MPPCEGATYDCPHDRGRVVLEEFVGRFPRHGIDKSRCVRVHMSNAEYESVPFTIR